MLTYSKLQSIICTAEIQKAEAFYGGTLELTRIGQSHGALIYDVGGSELRISPVASMRASEHTVMGFSVSDFDATHAKLSEKGINWERFPNFPQDAKGVLNLPDGAKVAWFRDPDGNLLSVVQYAAG